MFQLKTTREEQIRKEGLYLGILSVLPVIALHDAETIYREVVDLCEVDLLVRIARENGEMRFSGLSQYGYGKKVRDD